MAGRRSKLTKQLIKNAADLVKLGNYTETACAYLGIGKTSWYRWLQEGEQAKSGLKREFWEAIRQAEAQAEIRNIGKIQTAANDDWKASAWYLERKFPDRWGRKEHIDANLNHSGELNKKVDLALLNGEELNSLETIVSKLANIEGDQSGKGTEESS